MISGDRVHCCTTNARLNGGNGQITGRDHRLEYLLEAWIRLAHHQGAGGIRTVFIQSRTPVDENRLPGRQFSIGGNGVGQGTVGT